MCGATALAADQSGVSDLLGQQRKSVFERVPVPLADRFFRQFCRHAVEVAGTGEFGGGWCPSGYTPINARTIPAFWHRFRRNHDSDAW